MTGDARGFRADLEGLRGLAILLVVLFHAGVRWSAGGFVGVDVFFVLSGFFITRLLVREISDTGGIDVARFYGRRAARLLPALLVVLLATLAGVMWVYAPIDRGAVALTARAVALHSANMHFAAARQDYFGSTENPLLHTWSLGVEEQFYLVWPLLLLAFAAWASRKDGEQRTRVEHADATRARIATGVAICGGVSLAASLWLTGASQQWAFYGMPTRIWEFALGALVASSARGLADLPMRGSFALQAIGIVAVLVPVFVYDRVTPYPGTAAIWPALGSAALIMGGATAHESAITRALSAGWLRWLGRVSFAWYLWHWPLVGLGAVLDPQIGVAGRLAWSCAALLLAWATHHIVERGGRETLERRVPYAWLGPAALAASVGAAVLSHSALRIAMRQADSPVQRRFAAARTDRMDHDCWATTVDDARGACELGDVRASRVIVLFGDSHAEHWLGALDRSGRERGWKIVAMVKGGCPVADMPTLVNARFKRLYHECTRYREAMLRRIVAMRPDAVILSSWDHYLPVNGEGESWQVTPDMWRAGLRRTYQRLTRAGVTTVVIRGTPRAWLDVPACLSRRAARLPFARSCEYDRATSLSTEAVRAQDEAARGLPVRFVDMNDQICAVPRCPVVRNGAIVFTDDNHLTASFSRTLAPVLGARVASAIRDR